MLNKSQLKLQNESIVKLVVQFMTTTFFALLINNLYTLTDSLFVSWAVGDNAMGGVSIVFPYILIQSAISTALGAGASSIISRRLGDGDIDGASTAAFNSRIVFYISAIIITIIGYAAMGPILNMLGATPEIRGYATEYFSIILIGTVFSTGFSSLIRAEGKMVYGLLIWVVPVTINIILDAVFIFGLGWGVRGSAIATVIAQFVSFGMSIFFFAKISTLKFSGNKMSAKAISKILSIGLPSLIQTLALALSLLLINNVLRDVSGTLAINAFAYVSKIIILATIPFIALTQALSPIVGYNYGAKNFTRARKTVKITYIMSMIYAIFIITILMLIPDYLIMMFTKNPEIIEIGSHALRIVSISYLFVPLAMIVGASYQAKGQSIKSIIVSVINPIILVPCILIMGKYLKESGVWWSYVVAYALTNVVVIILAIVDNKGFSFLLKSSEPTPKELLMAQESNDMEELSRIIEVVDNSDITIRCTRLANAETIDCVDVVENNLVEVAEINQVDIAETSDELVSFDYETTADVIGDDKEGNIKHIDITSKSVVKKESDKK